MNQDEILKKKFVDLLQAVSQLEVKGQNVMLASQIMIYLQKEIADLDTKINQDNNK